MKKPVILYQPSGEKIHLTDENILTFNEDAQILYKVMRETEGEEILTEKYFTNLKTIVCKQWIPTMKKQHPEMPINVVVSKITNRLPHFIPGNKLIELIKSIISVWESLGVTEKAKAA